MVRRVVQRLRCAQLVYIVYVIIVYAVTFALLLPVILQDLPYSPYYNRTWNDMDVVRRVVWVCLLFPIYYMFSISFMPCVIVYISDIIKVEWSTCPVSTFE